MTVRLFLSGGLESLEGIAGAGEQAEEAERHPPPLRQPPPLPLKQPPLPFKGSLVD